MGVLESLQNNSKLLKIYLKILKNTSEEAHF